MRDEILVVARAFACPVRLAMDPSPRRRADTDEPCLAAWRPARHRQLPPSRPPGRPPRRGAEAGAIENIPMGRAQMVPGPGGAKRRLPTRGCAMKTLSTVQNLRMIQAAQMLGLGIRRSSGSSQSALASREEGTPRDVSSGRRATSTRCSQVRRGARPPPRSR